MALHRAITTGDLPRAQELQAISAEFVEALLEVGVLPGMKSAFAALGMDCGPTRAPLAARMPDTNARMAELVKRPSIAQWLGAAT